MLAKIRLFINLWNKEKKVELVYPISCSIILIIIWQVLVKYLKIPSYILPAPSDILMEFYKDRTLLLFHSKVTLIETILGLVISVFVSFIFAFLMEFIPLFKKCFYPLIYVTQMIPTITIAPLLVIWFGFGIKSKVLCVVLTCFFPILINFVSGLENIDIEYLNLFKIMKANKLQTFLHLKLPTSLESLFVGLRISATYAFIAAVVAEWLGGSSGLGVYMVRAKSSYALDRVFACNILIVLFSILFVEIIKILKYITLKKEIK